MPGENVVARPFVKIPTILLKSTLSNQDSIIWYINLLELAIVIRVYGIHERVQMDMWKGNVVVTGH